MKIRCDVCDKEEASVFCTADEASLCAACDHRVHHANKLASKHLRFALIYPSSSKHSFPLCDICQEKRALLFCQQDRAILCKDCDTPIHTANEHTKKHNRFLLTGVKLSATSSQYESTSITSSSACTSNHDFSVPGSSISNPPSQKPTSKSQTNFMNTQISLAKNHGEKLLAATAAMDKVGGGDDAVVNETGYTSTMSDYLIEMLPGWHVEDFLDSALAPFGFSKNDDGVLPYKDAEHEINQNRNIEASPSENLGIWVPQIPRNQPSSFPNHYPSYHSSSDNNNNTQTVSGIFKEAATTTATESMRLGQNKRCFDDLDGGFTVPQIPTTHLHQSFPFIKKSRSLW